MSEQIAEYCENCGWLCPKHAMVDYLLAALKAVEWSGDSHLNLCPACRCMKGMGHAKDCILNNAQEL